MVAKVCYGARARLLDQHDLVTSIFRQVHRQRFAFKRELNFPLVENFGFLHDIRRQPITAPEGAVIDTLTSAYAFLRLDIPISPSRPEPKSQMAGGIGTAVVSSNRFTVPS